MMKNPLRLITRKEISVVIGVAVIITLISIIVLVLTVPKRNRQISLAGQMQKELDYQALIRSTGFGIEDYFRDSQDPEMDLTYPIHPRQKIWTKKDIEFYWINPMEAGIDELEDNNDALIRDSLETHP